MSQYNGFLKRLGGFKGNISRKDANINIEISPENKKINLSFVLPVKYGAKIVTTTVFFGAVKRINAIYRFIAAKSALIIGRKAKPITAPATLAESENVFYSSNEAPIATHPATNATVNHVEKLSVFAGLVAYNRAACTYIKNVFMGCTANMISAVGAVAKYRKWMQLESTYKAEAADSVIMESRFNAFTAESEAVASSAPAVDTPAVETVFTAESTATVILVGVSCVNAQEEQPTANAAKIATWAEPVVVDGVLVLRQSYSATKENKKLVVS